MEASTVISRTPDSPFAAISDIRFNSLRKNREEAFYSVNRGVE